MAAGDLTTLDAARERLQLQVDATELDLVTEATITAASQAIRWSPYGREFAPAVTAEARDFTLASCGHLDLAPYDLRTVTTVVVNPGDADQATIAAADYRLGPVPAKHGVYTRLELSRTLVLPTPSTAWGSLRVRITGNWGFESVPPDIEQACLLYVVALIRGEVQAFGSALQPNSFGEGVNDAEAFPPGVRGLLIPYMRMGF